jgi:tRNA pseudouridine55 synthase
LNEVKRVLRLEKIGHGGTLDPFASGVLVMLLGEATKVSRFFLQGEKEYLATVEMGSQTDTDDRDGETISQISPPSLDLEQWKEIGKRFLGRQQQTPPAYSALKVAGRRSYELARKGEQVTHEPREIFIRDLEIMSLTKGTLQFRVVCSGGTYVRVLGRNLLESAGSTGHLRALRRTQSGNFKVSAGITLEQVNQPDFSWRSKLIGISTALQHLPKVELSESQAQRIRHGNLAVFSEIRNSILSPGYFLLVTGSSLVAIANHHPQLNPFCTIERVFDPNLTN